MRINSHFIYKINIRDIKALKEYLKNLLLRTDNKLTMI